MHGLVQRTYPKVQSLAFIDEEDRGHGRTVEARTCEKAYFLTFFIKIPFLFRVGKKGWKSQTHSPKVFG